MTLSLTGRIPLAPTRGLQFDAASEPHAGRSAERKRGWIRPLRRSLGLRGAAHALLVDRDGVWAWAPRDSHAAATRHASVQQWIEEHPGCDMRLWASGELVRSLRPAHVSLMDNDELLRSRAQRELIETHGEEAAGWALTTWKNEIAIGACALTGIDLKALGIHALRHGVRVQSVVPWWYHAFLEAKRCVSALNGMMSARVCVVEGRQIAWAETSGGLLTEVQQRVLDEPSVDALRFEIDKTQITKASQDQRRASTTAATTVLLGQGLIDGARTGGLNAIVLGRLDGEQPPQWLRPSLRKDMC